MSDEPTEMPGMTDEQREIVRRAHALLKSVEGKPKVSRALQERVEAETMDLAELGVRAAEERRAKEAAERGRKDEA